MSQKDRFKEIGAARIGDQIIQCLESVRTPKWKKTAEERNLLRWLGAAAPPPEKTLNINEIADRLEEISENVHEDKAFVREI